MSLPPDLERLSLSHPLLWRGRGIPQDSQAVLPSGHEALDQALPGGGWPVGALTEIIVPHWGIGELRLLIPAMVAMTGKQRWLLWIAPPYTPYAPALLQWGVDVDFSLLIKVGESNKDLLWSMEKLLGHPASGLLMAWPRHLPSGALRRLQLAAESSGTLGFLFCREGIQGSTAALRIRLQPAERGLTLEILKARGTWQRQRVSLSL